MERRKENWVFPGEFVSSIGLKCGEGEEAILVLSKTGKIPGILLGTSHFEKPITRGRGKGGCQDSEISSHCIKKEKRTEGWNQGEGRENAGGVFQGLFVKKKRIHLQRRGGNDSKAFPIC